jgi:hypothetical protein
MRCPPITPQRMDINGREFYRKKSAALGHDANSSQNAVHLYHVKLENVRGRCEAHRPGSLQVEEPASEGCSTKEPVANIKLVCRLRQRISEPRIRVALFL